MVGELRTEQQLKQLALLETTSGPQPYQPYEGGDYRGKVEICYSAYLNRVIQIVFTFWPIRKVIRERANEEKDARVEYGLLSDRPF